MLKNSLDIESLILIHLLDIRTNSNAIVFNDVLAIDTGLSYFSNLKLQCIPIDGFTDGIAMCTHA